MSFASSRRFVFASTLALVALAFAGCGSKESKWEGTYVSKGNDTLKLMPEHKGNATISGTSADITWEIAGDDKITANIPFPVTMYRQSDGSLRDQEGTIWKKK